MYQLKGCSNDVGQELYPISNVEAHWQSPFTASHHFLNPKPLPPGPHTLQCQQTSTIVGHASMKIYVYSKWMCFVCFVTTIFL
jgi:hypothetical protein